MDEKISPLQWKFSPSHQKVYNIQNEDDNKQMKSLFLMFAIKL